MRRSYRCRLQMAAREVSTPFNCYGRGQNRVRSYWPYFEKMEGFYGIVDGDTAVVEMALVPVYH